MAVIEVICALLLFGRGSGKLDWDNEKALAVYTGALAVATIVLAVATIGLWSYAAEQASDMKEAIEAIKTSAKAAQNATTIAERSLIAANRPWIKVSYQVAGPIVFNENGANSGAPLQNRQGKFALKYFRVDGRAGRCQPRLAPPSTFPNRDFSSRETLARTKMEPR